ncbi:hypothetical protein [Mesorhizobium sp.]|uniref:AbiTii domain-containing protein n=1 Tax=Mesorhizobium sp. TaxID=1871066 RepID=UPI00122135AF|nr:hypothetical protein [Mesorhizobium sp.]TIS46187.1 MAG: hypothetical protein E5W96_27800 [Mesorhizobium sp.]
MAQSEAEHILELSRELLDDIEFNRLETEKLLLKASRLARLSGSDQIKKWIQYELRGYVSDDEVSLYYMTITGRWVKREEQQGWWGPLSQQDATIDALKAQIETKKLTSISGDYALAVNNENSRSIAQLTNTIVTLSGIKPRVLSLLHSFVAGVYYERQFADVAERTFDGYKRNVDALIAEKAGSLLTKLPSVVARLNEGDEEAISQALVTCRRILEAFADAVYPPSDGTFEMGGNALKLDASKHQNRINVYIAQRTESSSRRNRLRQNLGNLFDRVSTGVHNDVTAQEAYSLFLNVYLFLGEVLTLPEAKIDAVEGDLPK